MITVKLYVNNPMGVRCINNEKIARKLQKRYGFEIVILKKGTPGYPNEIKPPSVGINDKLIIKNDTISMEGFERLLQGFLEKGGSVPNMGKTCIFAMEKQERQRYNCMICGGKLEYLEKAITLTCIYCKKVEKGYIHCLQGHYVCESCHGKDSQDVIKEVALTTKEKDPINIAELLMAHPEVSMLGCDNGVIAAASLMAAFKNNPEFDIDDEKILEAIKRTNKQAVSGYCGLTGVCGVTVGIGAAFSIALGATCGKDKESAIVMRVVARITDALASETGPACCKNYVRTALRVSRNLTKEFLGLKLPVTVKNIECIFPEKHPHGCRRFKCLYYKG